MLRNLSSSRIPEPRRCQSKPESVSACSRVAETRGRNNKSEQSSELPPSERPVPPDILTRSNHSWTRRVGVCAAAAVSCCVQQPSCYLPLIPGELVKLSSDDINV